VTFEQVYFARSLNLPHYQVSAEELPAFLKNIEDYKRVDARQRSLEVCHLRKGSDHLIPAMNVFNRLTEEMRAVVVDLPLDDLARVVLKTKTVDMTRGNIVVDVGYATDHNSYRDKEDGGVAKPRLLNRSTDPLFQKAMLAMTQMSDLACPPELKGKVFRDEKRNLLFSGKHLEGNRIEALRVALTSASHLVGCHVDGGNDTLPEFEGVINYSVWIFLEGEWWRLSLIGYSRKAISGSIRRRDRYMPLVERIVSFYENMDDERKDITSALLDFSGLDITVKRLKPHSNKCVFYSIFVTCLSRLTAQLRLSKWHVLAMITNCITSESPEFFVYATRRILKSEGKVLARYKSLSPVDLAFEFYSFVFDEKQRRTHSKERVPGQRHQPHYNKRQEKDIVTLSVNNFFDLFRAFEHIDSKMASDPHYYGKAVSFLENGYKSTGVFGAGGLTGQHLVHIGVLCGFFPAALMCHAEIGQGTASYTYLRRWEGLDDHLEDTRQLLACLCARTGLSSLVAENLVCKYGQEVTEQPPRLVNRFVLAPPGKSKAGTTKKKTKKVKLGEADMTAKWKPSGNPYRDSVYKGQSLHYLDSRLRHIKVTTKGSEVEESLATRCFPLEACFMPGVDLTPVPFSYWKQRFAGRRVVPMKACTRTHVRKEKCLTTVPTTRQQKKRKISPVTEFDDELDDELDDEDYEDYDDYDDCLSEGTGSINRRITRQGKRRALSWTNEVQQEDGGKQRHKEEKDNGRQSITPSPPPKIKFTVPTSVKERIKSLSERLLESDACATAAARIVDPCRVLACEAREELAIANVAMKALSYSRRFEKTFVKLTTAMYIPTIGRGKNMVTAHLEVPAEGAPRSWCPTAGLDSRLVATFFPGSVVMKDGLRYHADRKLATRFLYMAAILQGGGNIRMRDLTTQSQRQDSSIIVFCLDRINTKESRPQAAVVQQHNGDWAFSFVDKTGASVGSIIPVLPCVEGS
jgi:hypothetical protein